MKPKNLKFPYSWEERRPLYDDRVLYVPDYYDRHNEWSFPSFPEIFGNDKPVVIEYCAGNGTWIAEKAQRDPRLNWVAVEWRFERVRKIWSKMKNLGLDNLMIVCGEAVTFSRNYLPPSCIKGAFINFPDPWPKLKHAKNRLFQEPFISELVRTISPQGTITAVTDDAVYADQIKSEVLKCQKWKSRFADPCFVTDWPDYGTSYFDDLWRGKGRTIRYFQFEKLC